MVAPAIEATLPLATPAGAEAAPATEESPAMSAAAAMSAEGAPTQRCLRRAP
jgi:hypothetical protein